MAVILPGVGTSVATETRSGNEYQRVVIYPRGTTAFDTGLVSLPNTTGLLSSSTLYIASYYFHNGTDQTWKVTLENAAQTLKWLTDYPLGPRQVLFVPFGGPGASIVGLRWHAENTLVHGQVIGWT